jgi:hypothetical protein
VYTLVVRIQLPYGSMDVIGTSWLQTDVAGGQVAIYMPVPVSKKKKTHRSIIGMEGGISRDF